MSTNSCYRMKANGWVSHRSCNGLAIQFRLADCRRQIADRLLQISRHGRLDDGH